MASVPTMMEANGSGPILPRIAPDRAVERDRPPC